MMSMIKSPQYCICGVRVVEHCQIINNLTKVTIWIGNCCVKHVDQDKYESVKRATICLKRIGKIDNSFHHLNKDLVDMALASSIITEKEASFVRNMGLKRIMISAQSHWYFSIESKIIRTMETNPTVLKNNGINTTDKCDCGRSKKSQYNTCRMMEKY